jgi:hypothetical protein
MPCLRAKDERTGRVPTSMKVFSSAQAGVSEPTTIAIRCWSYAADRFVGQRDPRFNRRNRSENRPGDPHALALAVRRLPGSCALLSLGFLIGRASPSGGLMPALESRPGWPAMAAVVAGASGKGATGVSVARVAGDAPGSTYQRASASDLILDLGGASSSIATGTSGSAGFALAATTGSGVSSRVAGCGASTRVAGPVISVVAVGPYESAVIERVTPSANNNANASHMMVCFIAASSKPIE